MDSVGFFRRMMERRRQGVAVGIPSICSASGLVLQSAFALMRHTAMPLLIESTASQVNQFGGYTGMRPKDFAEYALRLAGEESFPAERLMLGGDHLGPLPWMDRPEKEAMRLAADLVAEYVQAGYDKIHIDTSMRLGDDNPRLPLSDAVIARRGAFLCEAAERAHAACGKEGARISPPVYVLGSEVPVPGGSRIAQDHIEPTSPEACRASIAAFREAFSRQGIPGAWQRVIAFVVQPGVEFFAMGIHTYRPHEARHLCSVLETQADMVFEGHSTDYQPTHCLRQMVRDGIAILKVGPALTFAQREALCALEEIEKALFCGSGRTLSDFSAVLEHAMLQNSSHWQGYYTGNILDQKFLRRYSFSDRSRYYLSNKAVTQSVDRLFANTESQEIPLPLISRFFPAQLADVQSGTLRPQTSALVKAYIGSRLSPYLAAAGGPQARNRRAS